MNRGPSDHELDRLLAGLPREQASPGFSRRLFAKLESPARPQRGRPGLLLAAAAVAAALLLAVWWAPRPEPTADPAPTERALREEHRALMEELEALKASMPPSDLPLLYLGGDEQLDLVLDLGPVWGLEPAGAVPAALAPRRGQPASTADRRNGGSRR